jgi:hypothetical protein
MCYDLFMVGWKKPVLADALDVLEKAATSLQLQMEDLLKAFRTGELVDLEGWVWCSLDNTDSNDCFCLAEAEARAKLHGRDEDFVRITNDMTKHKVLQAPLILLRGPLRPYLVDGNLRLMGCRALSVRPKVWLMHLEDGR